MASFLNDDLSIRDYYVTANFGPDKRQRRLDWGLSLPRQWMLSMPIR